MRVVLTEPWGSARLTNLQVRSGTRTLVGGGVLWADNVTARNSPQIALDRLSHVVNVRLPHHQIQLTKSGDYTF
jgi:hypothetical protein